MTTAQPMLLEAERLTADAFERERIRRGVRARVFGGNAEPLRLGRYEVIERIAEGGTSMVYLGRDEALQRPVALKVMVADEATHAELALRVAREGHALARLNHPGSVRVFDVGEQDGLPFLVVELVEGETLGAWMRAEARSWREVLSVMMPLGEALATAHAVGLIHRDIKPGNILRDERGVARLVDFGFAQEILAVEEISGAHLRSELQGAQTTSVGTPLYMAPEQWDGAPCDERTDQFSFCITLYEALHGRLPYAQDARDRLEFAADSVVPAWLDELLERGSSRDPDDRFERLEDLLTAIRERLQSVQACDDAETAIARAAADDDPLVRREQGLVARQALEQARALWPDNPRLRRAQTALAARRFEDALTAGDLESAEAQLGALAESDVAAARQRLDEARDEAEAPQRRLAELEHERDTGVEERFKAQTLIGSALGWTLAYAVLAWLHHAETLAVTPWVLAAWYMLAVLGGAIGLKSLPDKYAANRVNRHLTLVAIIVPGAHVVTTVGCALLGGGTAMALLFAHGQAATSYGIAGLAYDRRAALLTPPNIVGLLAIALWPEQALVISAAVVPFGSFAWAWSHHRAARRSEA